MPAIDVFFKTMVDFGASDLHMVAESPPLLRMSGEIRPLKYRPIPDAELRSMLFEMLSERDRKRFTESGDLDCAYELAGVARFRVNVFEQQRGVGAVFRQIPTKILSMQDLNLPPAVGRFVTMDRGLVVVTGPTGSGKSTTLAAIVNEINSTRRCHIITIEDPIEFVHEPRECLITQREVGGDTKGFSKALRAAIREDPDVILVGEMRDPETIGLAITAAEMGVLVFGTLHTNSAPKTVDRVIDAFPASQQDQIRTQLAESLQGVVAQQLLKRASGKGRVAAIELLFGSSALANIIREGKTHQIAAIMQTGKGEGMQTMDQVLLDLVMTKVITVEDAYAKAHDKKLFDKSQGGAKAVENAANA
ncbi:MAG: type IV pilus twitching motility protein PilT [Candidatus Schekmanbacteria bacterium]|nr:type IV pilus twitching motility protein PilT [Candidatus Schekmanbacteria bacterium]